ncbi:MAG: TIGR03557 family F420-dependent LLM class oxidoreductase [Dehalococcoidia bacterium]|nr:TIGR03557 family F420-dependent LLM class oxidoreductase [Dehalococcoidia bacterium]
MVEIGFSLSSEEHRPNELVRQAAMAEEAGFTFALMSDHYHPWVTAQGQSPFVWSVLGGVAQATKTLRVGTGVTCPIMRIHPAIIAQAAATTADMFEGRFFLGLGAGENLNEHVTGEHWPQPAIRHEMLCEAIAIIRELWTGEEVNRFGEFYAVDEAKLFTVPAKAPEIFVAASGTQSAELAATQDGLISTSPSAKIIEAYGQAGGNGPRIGQFAVCYDENEKRARKMAREIWPISGLTGNANWEIKTVEHFDQLTQMVTEDAVAESIACGSDPAKVTEKIDAYVEAGFDCVYMHQIGPEQETFINWAAREILPRYQRTPVGAGSGRDGASGR